MTSEKFVGTWKLVSAVISAADGSVLRYPFGEAAIGRIIYDAGGNMSAQLMAAERPRFASEDTQQGTDAEVRAAFDGMVSYFGTYTVDEVAGTVTHHVEGSYFPNWEGGEQVRFYEFSADGLRLSTPPIPFGGEQATFVLHWQRA